MLMRPLGRTGVQVSAIGLGGSHIGEVSSRREAVRLIREALDRGLTFLDNSWDYHGGRSERWMGKALEGGYRDKAFLMTKIDGRTKKAASKQLDQSLRRLRTDRIDLVQHHEIIRYDDADRIFAEDGANAALIEAREAGKIRFIGFTGHKHPAIHLHMLETASIHGFSFDTVQMPLNVLDAHFRSFEHEVLPKLVERGIGVLGMKSLANGSTLEAGVSAIECIQYALSLPTSVVICGVDSQEILDQAFRAVETWKPMDQPEKEALLARTRAAALDGHLEAFKTTQKFDWTAQHPRALG
jgi:aryl-alcohol dehydrogenase-like predicted oxidoreductase